MTVLKIQGQKVLYRSKHTEYCEHQIFTVSSFHQLFYCLSHETLKQGRAGPTWAPAWLSGGAGGRSHRPPWTVGRSQTGHVVRGRPSCHRGEARRGEGRGGIWGVSPLPPPWVWAPICPVQEGCQPFPPPAPPPDSETRCFCVGAVTRLNLHLCGRRPPAAPPRVITRGEVDPATTETKSGISGGR